MKYFSFIGKANIARVLVHDLEIAIAETKIGGIATETGIGIATGRGGTVIVSVIVIVGAAGTDGTETESSVMVVTETETGGTEIGIETEGEKDH